MSYGSVLEAVRYRALPKRFLEPPKKARRPDSELSASAAPPGVEVGMFTFAPQGSPPIEVYYAAAGEDRAHAQIVFVHHGILRNAADYRDHWAALIQDRNVIVVAPQFGEDHFSGSGRYNRAGLHPSVPEAERSGTYIDPLFAEVVARFGGNQTEFDMFGHSAGAQFVHRYATLFDAPSVRRAVVANAGWYTFPNPETAWPYGWRDAPHPTDLRSALARRIVVLLGDRDIDSRDPHLRRSRGARAQGINRLTRGVNFHDFAHATAQEAGLDCHWALHVVPGAQHAGSQMAIAAAQILLDD